MTDSKNLVNRLRQLRFAHDEMSQEALAQAVGVSRQTIYAIEKGKFNPSIKLALQLAELFHVAVEDLFYFEETET